MGQLRMQRRTKRIKIDDPARFFQRIAVADNRLK
jgi:hypothetical protein